MAKSKARDPELFDVAIVGAGPAGATAAILLSRDEHRVALIDREKFPRQVPCAGWISGKGKTLASELDPEVAKTLSCPFSDVTLYSADFTKKTKPHFDGPAGYLTDRAEFDNAMVEAAVRAGAVFRQGAAVTDVRLDESSISLTLGTGDALESRLLLLASGRSTELLDRVGFTRRQGDAPIWTAQVVGSPRGTTIEGPPAISVVLGLDGANSFGFCAVAPGRVIVNVNWRGEPEQVLAHLVRLCRTAYENQIVPMDLSKRAASAPVFRSPAAAALDMDTHVGKHTLLVGDAGGFVSAASNEGVFPAMWSAKIAVRAVHAALESTYSQDELMTFDSLWRMEMADHLRSPHTDIRFLLPLVFSNQPMADRMGAAFFAGDNI